MAERPPASAGSDPQQLAASTGAVTPMVLQQQKQVRAPLVPPHLQWLYSHQMWTPSTVLENQNQPGPQRTAGAGTPHDDNISMNQQQNVQESPPEGLRDSASSAESVDALASVAPVTNPLNAVPSVAPMMNPDDAHSYRKPSETSVGLRSGVPERVVPVVDADGVRTLVSSRTELPIPKASSVNNPNEVAPRVAPARYPFKNRCRVAPRGAPARYPFNSQYGVTRRGAPARYAFNDQYEVAPRGAPARYPFNDQYGLAPRGAPARYPFNEQYGLAPRGAPARYPVNDQYGVPPRLPPLPHPINHRYGVPPSSRSTDSWEMLPATGPVSATGLYMFNPSGSTRSELPEHVAPVFHPYGPPTNDFKPWDMSPAYSYDLYRDISWDKWQAPAAASDESYEDILWNMRKAATIKNFREVLSLDTSPAAAPVMDPASNPFRELPSDNWVYNSYGEPPSVNSVNNSYEVPPNVAPVTNPVNNLSEEPPGVNPVSNPQGVPSSVAPVTDQLNVLKQVKD